MADKGKWVFIPDKDQGGCGGIFIMLAIGLFLALIAILILPLLIPIAAVLMASNQKWKFGIAGVLAFIYVQIDFSKQWISSVFFFGDDAMFSMDWLSYITIGNYIGLAISALFIGLHFLNNKPT